MEERSQILLPAVVLITTPASPAVAGFERGAPPRAAVPERLL